MELTLEAYALIAKLVGGRADLCSLCRVSKASQLAAERALYNTINLADPETACVLFNLFAEQPRVSPLVVALTISLEDDDEASNGTPLVLPPDYWQVVSRGLQHLPYLRFLHIYIDDGSDPHNAWCLNSCHFQLQTFHCDLSWDASLVTFLSKQNEITDLYIADFNEDTPENVLLVPHSLRGARSLPILRNVECTFTEAVGALVPGRPVTCVKTCFSRSDIAEKRAEMAIFIANLHLSTQSLLSINVADSSYTSAFSLEFLRSLVDAISPDAALRYLGVLAFPVDSKERLMLYGYLRRLPYLRCLELEISEWDPPPLTPLAQRSLARELQLYCPLVETVIFTFDFEPMVLSAVGGTWENTSENYADTLWRDF